MLFKQQNVNLFRTVLFTSAEINTVTIKDNPIQYPNTK